MSESRADLIAWVNDLLGISYTKVEQLGSGAAYAQIMDSIYGDIPMARVKFASKHEYEYLANYKVLQNSFLLHKVDKTVPMERLMKCKMQDNLEFLQWLKKFWDSSYPGGQYDAVGRRGGASDHNAAANRSTNAAPRRAVNNAANRSVSGRGAGLSAGNTSLRKASPDHSIVLNLQKELQEERNTVAALEKERDFYFGKLRDIEVLIQQDQEKSPEVEESALVKEIHQVLYSTEEGFEIPAEEAQDEGNFPDETF
ncbi:calponin homology domain-containing protein [Dissophora ornata]|nr:hypothetical protein BGZ58_005943 [Dissophora ornata]KAI8605111.1 calponin homology domain-containing protein [Dissophora ornata]